MEHTCEITVRSYELDQYGHVNNAVYLNYLEHARHQFLNDTGFDYTEYLRLGNGLYVSHIDIRYLRPAYMDDLLKISTTCTYLGKVKGTVFQRISCKDVSLIEASVDFAMVNSTGRPTPIPSNILSGWRVAAAMAAGKSC